MDNTVIETLVLRKMAFEAFGMIFDGELLSAKKVFSALAQKRPEARAPVLGLAMVDFAAKDMSGASKEGGYIDYKDPFMDCIQGMVWLREGRTSEAKALLERVLSSGDAPAVELAETILTHEVGGL